MLPVEIPLVTEHVFAVVTLLRGAGVAAEKSEALLSVSVHPLAALKTLSIAEGAGVAPLPS